MKKKILLLCALLLFIFVYSFLFKDPIEYSDVKIAILDSGINEKKLIHKSYNTFTNDEKTEDKFNHGTKIFNIIHKVAPKNQQVDYYDIQVLNDHGLGSVVVAPPNSPHPQKKFKTKFKIRFKTKLKTKIKKTPKVSFIVPNHFLDLVEVIFSHSFHSSALQNPY